MQVDMALIVSYPGLPCLDRYARGMISGTGSTLFEELGLYYIGPVDGHNLDDLIAVLQGGLNRTKPELHDSSAPQ